MRTGIARWRAFIPARHQKRCCQTIVQARVETPGRPPSPPNAADRIEGFLGRPSMMARVMGETRIIPVVYWWVEAEPFNQG
ncbi:hypothetical protein [Sorangium sp. So ce131]|uniref:hypothetical protein n=1 Tax=Sorangium sp. So ce131 TaxID=3133282 RepID=UPI003F62D13E